MNKNNGMKYTINILGNIEREQIESRNGRKGKV